MRLQQVENTHSLKYRLMFGAVRALSRERAPDVMRALLYRPTFFGRHFGRALQPAMRGPSFFSVGERELFAAWTSRLNDCEF